MHLILTGATGLVGASVLNHILTLPAGEVTRLSIISRKPVPMAEGHTNVEVITHTDFAAYPSEMLAKLKGAEGCVWAVGVSQNNVAKEEYVNVTKDWPVAAATAFKDLAPEGTAFRFIYVSAEGATTSPGRFTPLYCTTKGAAEAALQALAKESQGTLAAYSLRPGYVDALRHPELRDVLAKSHSTLTKRLEDRVGAVMRVVMPNMVSATPELGRVLALLALGRLDKEVQGLVDGKEVVDQRNITNIGFKRLAGLK